MTQAILFDLEHHRKRLDYYVQLKTQIETKLALNPAPVTSSKKAAPAKAAPAKAVPSSVETWIEIYAERVKKLENQAVRLGLMTREQLKTAKTGKYVH